MNPTSNKKLTANARELRKNMTKEERHLWYDFLKELPVMVHRQKVIGRYIVDFYIAKAQIVIELDGSQHYDPEEMEKDAIRSRYLESLGILVLRFSNRDIKENLSGVCQAIDIAVNQRLGMAGIGRKNSK